MDWKEKKKLSGVRTLPYSIKLKFCLHTLRLCSHMSELDVFELHLMCMTCEITLIFVEAVHKWVVHPQYRVLCIFWALQCKFQAHWVLWGCFWIALVFDFSTDCYYRSWHPYLLYFWPALKTQLWQKSGPEPCKFSSEPHQKCTWTAEMLVCGVLCFFLIRSENIPYNSHRTCVNPA